MQTILALGPALPLTLSGTAVALVIVAIWLAGPWLKVQFGILAVYRAAHRLGREGLHVLHDAVLRIDGKEHHVDHVIVGNDGVIVIRLLHRSGAISGSPHDATWVEQRGQRTNRFPNPLRHNERYTAALKKVLGRNLRVRHLLVPVGSHPATPIRGVASPRQLAPLLRETLPDVGRDTAAASLAVRLSHLQGPTAGERARHGEALAEFGARLKRAKLAAGLGASLTTIALMIVGYAEAVAHGLI